MFAPRSAILLLLMHTDKNNATKPGSLGRRHPWTLQKAV